MQSNSDFSIKFESSNYIRLPKFILTARVSVSFVLTARLAMHVNKEDSC